MWTELRRVKAEVEQGSKLGWNRGKSWVLIRVAIWVTTSTQEALRQDAPTTFPYPCSYLAFTRNEISPDTCPYHCRPSYDTPVGEVWLRVSFNISIIAQKKVQPQIISWLPELLAPGLPDALSCKLCGYLRLRNEINGSDKFILLMALVVVGRYHPPAPTRPARPPQPSPEEFLV